MPAKTKPCKIRGCENPIWIGTKRPQKDLCVYHFMMLRPTEFKEYTNGMVVRENDKKLGRKRIRGRHKKASRIKEEI